MWRLAKVNDFEKIRSIFYLFVFGGVAGVSPAEGEAEKPEALKRGGDFPLLIKTVRDTPVLVMRSCAYTIIS
jgi:hypothetical protein